MEQPSAMQRPLSITRFERLYLGAIVVGLASTMLGWSQSTATFAANAMLAERMWILPATVLGGIVLRVALWYFTARQPSIAAKWIVVALAALSGIILLFGVVALITGATPSLAASLAGIISGALYVVAAAYLFRPDARAWFGETDLTEQEHDA
jgi:RsiW-degrading membrane proteinase PrsW (M82 family)